MGEAKPRLRRKGLLQGQGAVELLRLLAAGLLLAVALGPAPDCRAQEKGAYGEARTLSENPSSDGKVFDGTYRLTPYAVNTTLSSIGVPKAPETELSPEAKSSANLKGGVWGGIIGGLVGVLLGLAIAWSLSWTLPGFIVGALFVAVGIYAGVDVGQAIANDDARAAAGLPRKGD